MKTRGRLFLRLLTPFVFLAGAHFSSAQITYVNQRNGALTLREMAPNGSADVRVPFPLARVGFPIWSQDGRFLTVAAFQPSNIPTRTWNVYSITRSTGAVRRLTNYRDLLDPTTNSASYTFPWYKTMSRNGASLATFSLTQTAGPNSTGTGGGVVDVPVLEIHSLTTRTNPILVHVDKTKNGKHHSGEGVDWSPVQNVLAAPLQSSAPYIGASGRGETTAIFLIPPTLQAVRQGRARQVTFPRASYSYQTGVMWTEHDYQPKFSPNGVGLAYVRSFQSHALLTSLNPNQNIQSLRVRNLTTGVEREVRRFAQGRYITTIDWSPDGNWLVFDLALQASGPLGPLQQGRPDTNQIYIIRANGTDLRQLRGNGNGTPVWR